MFNLRYYQRKSSPAIFSYLGKNKEGNPLVCFPTGSGKTICIVDLIKKYRIRSDAGIIVLSHVKEILEQNYKAIENSVGHSGFKYEEIGLNSSMLGRREIKPITVAGIQSVYRNPEKFKSFKLVIIDEAHLISSEQNSMYQKFFNGIGKHNRVGFTATPYRLNSGYIYGNNNDNSFDSIVCDWTKTDKFNELIDRGYLTKLTTKRTKLEMDTSGIKLIGGDFSEKQLSEKFDRISVTNEAIKEIIVAGKNRKKWIVFAIDIAHAEHIAETLIRNEIPTTVIHSDMNKDGFCREKAKEGYKNGRYKCIVNVNILTTGFDDPGIDLIACLRPTKSPVLHVQSLGRGSRIEEGKKDCLVLDFAGNTERLGPVNNPVIAKKGKGKGVGDPITKTCPNCQSIIAPAVRVCPDCGHKFKFEHNLNSNASFLDVIDYKKPTWVNVDNISYELHTNPGGPSSLKVIYLCEGRAIKEYICIEHRGFAKHKADHWAKYRGVTGCKKAKDLLAKSEDLMKPKKILIQKKGKYYTVNDASFN